MWPAERGQSYEVIDEIRLRERKFLKRPLCRDSSLFSSFSYKVLDFSRQEQLPDGEDLKVENRRKKHVKIQAKIDSKQGFRTPAAARNCRVGGGSDERTETHFLERPVTDVRRRVANLEIAAANDPSFIAK